MKGGNDDTSWLYGYDAWNVPFTPAESVDTAIRSLNRCHSYPNGRSPLRRIDCTLHAAARTNPDAPRLPLDSFARARSHDLGWRRWTRWRAMSRLAYDCRGHGRSDKPAGLIRRAIRAGSCGTVRSRRLAVCRVAGCSMGGMRRPAFGGLYPARATALGLIDTTAWYGAEAPQQWRERAAKRESEGLAGPGRIFSSLAGSGTSSAPNKQTW